MQIFSKRRDIFKNRRDAGESSQKRDSPAKIGTCGHLRQNVTIYFLLNCNKFPNLWHLFYSNPMPRIWNKPNFRKREYRWLDFFVLKYILLHYYINQNSIACYWKLLIYSERYNYGWLVGILFSNEFIN